MVITGSPITSSTPRLTHLLALIRQRGLRERLQHAPPGEQDPAGLDLQRPEWELPQSSTEVRAVEHSGNLAIRVDNIETSKTLLLGPSGLLTGASIAHQAGLLVCLLQADKVLWVVFVMVVTPEASTAVAASGVHTEGVMEEAVEEVTGKLKK